MLKEMCVEAGITTNYSNHSLRAYGATTMFQAGISEKLITKNRPQITGVLHQYECTSETQLLDASNVVSYGQNSNQRNMPLVAKSQQSKITSH